MCIRRGNWQFHFVRSFSMKQVCFIKFQAPQGLIKLALHLPSVEDSISYNVIVTEVCCIVAGSRTCWSDTRIFIISYIKLRAFNGWLFRAWYWKITKQTSKMFLKSVWPFFNIMYKWVEYIEITELQLISLVGIFQFTGYIRKSTDYRLKPEIYGSSSFYFRTHFVKGNVLIRLNDILSCILSLNNDMNFGYFRLFASS